VHQEYGENELLAVRRFQTPSVSRHRFENNICSTHALNLQSQENINWLMPHIHQKAWWFQRESTNLSQQRKCTAREYELDCTKALFQVITAAADCDWMP